MSNSNFKSGYSDVNGIKMYYEICGEGKPLVLIHGGGSFIQTSFGNLIPYLVNHRQIIAMDLQAHGRTGDRDADLSFKQDADDIAMLLKNLGIKKADFLGFSNGGQTVIELALRYGDFINKLIICSALYKRDAAAPEFWKGFENAKLEVMPQNLKDEFLKVNNNKSALQNMFDKDVKRMKNFKGWSDEEISSIKFPVLIMTANNDVGSPEHAVEMYRYISGSELVILPGNHGEYLGAIDLLSGRKWKQTYSVEIIVDFLNK